MRSRNVVRSLWLLGIGLAAGIYFQHRWPLGRLRAELATRPAPAPLTSADVARLSPARRLVIVVAGQSNAANHGDTRRAAGAGVYAFAEGRLHLAVDPLPGASGYGGSPWTRLGARLVAEDGYEAVVFAAVAQGSTRASDWAPGGRHHEALVNTLQGLAVAGLPADFVLWQQGEAEGRSAAEAGQDYQAALQGIIATSREHAPQALVFVAQATYTTGVAVNEQIRFAQRAAAALPGAAPGPDVDQLGAAYRSDGVHFNEQGLAALADRWHTALQPALERQRQPPAMP